MVTRRAALMSAAGLAAAPLVIGTARQARAEAAGIDTRPETGPDMPPEDISKLPRIKPTLVAPPFVHDHDQVAPGGPRVVEFELPIVEKEVKVAEDAYLQALTFNGSIPAPLLVVHQGDYVELTLVNPETNIFEHNIDLHASTGGLGCGSLTHVSPGQKVTVRFRATRAGVFVYHCAPGGTMIPFHVVSGMNGAIMVLPRNGLTDDKGQPVKYDRVYYVGEQDLYIPKDKDGAYKRYDNAAEAMADTQEVMRGLIPSHIVFNGAVGALTGKNAMAAKVGEKVLVIHSQANRDTRPHLIGGHGDLVWNLGKFSNAPMTDLETWFIPGGSAAAMLYKFRQPGLYAYLNHNLIEAIDLGAAAHFQVEGTWNDDLMTQVVKPTGV